MDITDVTVTGQFQTYMTLENGTIYDLISGEEVTQDGEDLDDACAD